MIVVSVFVILVMLLFVVDAVVAMPTEIVAAFFSMLLILTFPAKTFEFRFVSAIVTKSTFFDDPCIVDLSASEIVGGVVLEEHALHNSLWAIVRAMSSFVSSYFFFPTICFFIES